MPPDEVVRLHAWLGEHEQQMLETLRALLRIPSVESEPQPGMPFGEPNRRALDFMLSSAGEAGMVAKDLDGYIGYAEFGTGERLVMSLGHLDVVPVGDGWKHEPFGAEIDGEYLYARGAVDDKGPTVASFFAARALKEVLPGLPARIRSVFGCNEESGFKCVERYMLTEEAPTFGIAPDSGWPLYHAEKGICNLEVGMRMIEGGLTLLEAAGGQRPNIVIDRCQARCRVHDSALSQVREKLADRWDRNIECELNGKDLNVVATGKAAHGSTPFAGDSAATRVFRFLAEISPLDTELQYRSLLDTTHISGVGLGVHGRDDVSADLTCNLGIVRTEDCVLRLTYNIRYPVTWKGEDVQRRCKDHLATLPAEFTLEGFSDSPSLYFPLDHPLVSTIVDVYKAETGEELKPGVMGGGTYARAVPNTVSVGTGWEGDGRAHETDERLKVEHLYKMSRIYAHILYRLATHP